MEVETKQVMLPKILALAGRLKELVADNQILADSELPEGVAGPVGVENVNVTQPIGK